MHEYVQLSRKGVQPPEGVRTDYDILSDLGGRLDPAVTMPSPEEALRDALRSPSLDTSLEDLRARGFARTTHPALAFEGLRFGHADGLYRFPERLDGPLPAPEGYPLHLLTLINRRFVHSRSRRKSRARDPSWACIPALWRPWASGPVRGSWSRNSAAST